MIPVEKASSVVEHGITVSEEYGVSAKDVGYIMSILRSSVYSDKISAVIREYCSNAWDAHRMHGKGDLPTKVTLPTLEVPRLLIRDFGVGLSESDVLKYYTQYGDSSKRGTNAAVGEKGIGSKSGHAYADAFEVTSYFGGKKAEYVSMIGDGNRGRFSKLTESDCGDEVGVEISINVRQEDVAAFQEKGRAILSYFDPPPDCGMVLRSPVENATAVPSGWVLPESERSRGWIAVMGCVAYRVNPRELKDRIPAGWEGVGLVIPFKIGEVETNAGREELSYSKETLQVLEDAVYGIIMEYTAHVEKLLNDASKTNWEKRLLATGIVRGGIPLPRSLEYGAFAVSIPDQYRCGKGEGLVFSGTKGRVSDTRDAIAVQEGVRVILRDVYSSTQRYDLRRSNVMVLKQRGFKGNWDAAEIEVRRILSELKLDGIPVVRLSSLHVPYPRYPSSKPPGKPELYAHEKVVFDPKKYAAVGVRSHHWIPFDGAPPPKGGDVSVILTRFEVDDGRGQGSLAFYERISRILRDAAKAGVPVPRIVGYRSTVRKPIQFSKVPEPPFSSWLKTLAHKVLTKDVLQRYEARVWYYTFSKVGYEVGHTVEPYKAAARSVKGFDPNHWVLEMFDHILRHKLQITLESDYEIYADAIGWEDTAAAASGRIDTAYPLLELGKLCRTAETDQWQYIAAMDLYRRTHTP